MDYCHESFIFDNIQAFLFSDGVEEDSFMLLVIWTLGTNLSKKIRKTFNVSLILSSAMT